MNPATRLVLPFSLLTVTSTVPAACAGVVAARVNLSIKVTEGAGVPPNTTVLAATEHRRQNCAVVLQNAQSRPGWHRAADGRPITKVIN